MQISAKNLTGTTETDILNQLYRLLADLRSTKEVQQFLSCFMTETERLVFAKRLAITWLLEQGYSYEEISRQLNVSSATISSAAELRYQPEMKGAYRKLFLATWTKRILKRITFWRH